MNETTDLDNYQAFENSQTLANWLANHIAQLLTASIDQTGKASLAVSGGSTPKAFFQALSNIEIEWNKVTITLVDERWVKPDNPRSNQKMVMNTLLQNNASKANFIPLYRDGLKPEDISKIEIELIELLPFDVLILGMGTDGHTASLFPMGSNLDEAISLETDRTIIEMETPDSEEVRVTLTLPTIAKAKNLFLHIEGDEKLSVLDTASKSDGKKQLPIAHVLKARSDLNVIWAP